MPKKKGNPSPPRHKRLNRPERLLAAPRWLETYRGANLVQGYRKHFGVDLICAIAELRLLGVHIEEQYVQQVKQNMEVRREKAKRKQVREDWPWAEMPDFLA